MEKERYVVFQTGFETDSTSLLRKTLRTLTDALIYEVERYDADFGIYINIAAKRRVPVVAEFKHIGDELRELLSYHTWSGMDSNHQCFWATDLQSAAIPILLT